MDYAIKLFRLGSYIVLQGEITDEWFLIPTIKIHYQNKLKEVFCSRWMYSHIRVGLKFLWIEAFIKIGWKEYDKSKS
ncbi:hypothetical protein M0R19_05160 [Candidatus Pacearchaeota archaeon]|jgi:hypothetical protein|nr:hypothetical protein [Candidatus Pacearchaeota archaeon]